jgi:glycosyltransferase involved in cell wall biosynthesis
VRIAQIAPCWLTVPPVGYGGIEAMVALLADGLVDKGHEVTLFASGGSRTKGSLSSYYDEAPGTAAGVADPLLELPHALSAYNRADEFDVIHDHTFPIGPSIGAHRLDTPVVHTVHGPPQHPNLRPMYELIGNRIHLVAISNFQREMTPNLEYAATVHNGICVQDHPWKEEKEDYLLFVGRMNPEKGVHLAVEAASRLGRRLRVAGKMSEPAEKEYFESEVRPRLTDDVTILGEASGKDKLDLYANAACTLIPIQWAEPFGLVMIESMACGTPVIATRWGAVPEVIEDGRSGIIVDNYREMAAALEQADDLDPLELRRYVEEEFSPERMVRDYVGAYEAAIAAAGSR